MNKIKIYLHKIKYYNKEINNLKKMNNYPLYSKKLNKYLYKIHKTRILDNKLLKNINITPF